MDSAHPLVRELRRRRRAGYAQDLDSRTYLAITEILKLRGQLERIAAWHARETAEGGMVGDFCTECGELWPCDTRRMADGSHEDLAADG